MHEHIQVSLLLGRRAKENLTCCFHSVLQAFERESQQKNFPFRFEGKVD